jgi:hypothetical protein
MTLTLDNASNNDTQVEELSKSLQEANLLWERDLLQHRCVAHVLNLIAKDGLHVLSEELKKVSNIRL